MMLDASSPISNLDFNCIYTPIFKLYQYLRLVFVIECKKIDDYEAMANVIFVD